MFRVFATVSMTTLALAACVPDQMPETADGRALFMENCAICHGADARGNGPMSSALTPPPLDLTLIAASNGGTFPRAKVLSAIDGYTKSDLSGPNMPEFGDLLRGDLVPYDSGDGVLSPTPRKLVALVEYLEAVQDAR